MDDVDKAKNIEMQARQIALDQQLAAGQETEQPDEHHGVRYCLDCGEPIPLERLIVRPESVRCIDCKTLKEKQNRYNK